MAAVYAWYNALLLYISITHQYDTNSHITSSCLEE